MYAYLKGILVSSSPSHVVIEAYGIGYYVLIPCSALGGLPQNGQLLHLYTSLVIREFAHSLYGFLLFQERDVFEVLMNVTGIGPKLALSLIGHLPYENLQMAISQSDLPSLCKVPGVGKKTAERLIVELRDKLPDISIPKAISTAVQFSSSNRQEVQDAMQALINLGYTQSVAQKAVKQSLKDLPDHVDLATLITSALKNI